MTSLQKKQFQKTLNEYNKSKPILVIFEVGLNGGHSATTLINGCPFLEKFISFDINHHKYTPLAANFLRQYLNDKFIFIEGDSLKTVPEYLSSHTEIKPDLIYIDGCHLYEYALNDILNFKESADEETFLWIDDVDPGYSNAIGKAVKYCVDNGIIKILKLHTSNDNVAGYRGWVEAKFCK